VKKKLALLAAPIAMLAASTTTAANLLWDIKPYVGADAEWRHMNFQKGFGNNLFTHNYPQGNFYLGAQFNKYLAVEAGYEKTEGKTRTSILQTGDIQAGVLIDDPDTTLRENSTGQIKGLHVNVIGLLPLCEAYRLQLIGMVGVTRLKSKLIKTITHIDNVVILDDLSTHFKAKKSIFRLGAGLQHMINCNWGVRAMVKWEASKKLKMIGIENPELSIRPKNSFIYSIGAFYRFN
jgi:opacity protein-like surface antigen